MVGQVSLGPVTPRTLLLRQLPLLNTGEQLCRLEQRPSQYRLLSVRGSSPVYGPRGLNRGHRFRVQWLRDQLQIIREAAEVETLASQVDSAAHVYFVPRSPGSSHLIGALDARGVIVGLSRFHTRAHIARATLEAICYQSRDVVEAMRRMRVSNSMN